MKNSGIGWTHDTWNTWVNCDPVSPECANCYIEIDVRKQTDWQTGEKRVPFNGKLYRTSPTTWHQPDRLWTELRDKEQASGRRLARRVFTCSLSDFFHPKADEWRPKVWERIRWKENLVFLILTKRPDRILSRLPDDWGQGYRNVWLGVSVGCKQALNRLDSLRRVSVHREALRFLSAEPLLEDISEGINLDGFGWVIAGGESGRNPEHLWTPNDHLSKDRIWYVLHRDNPKTPPIVRPNYPGRRMMDLVWARNLQQLCAQRKIPFYFKQITAPYAGVGADELGSAYHQIPPAPDGREWDS